MNIISKKSSVFQNNVSILTIGMIFSSKVSEYILKLSKASVENIYKLRQIQQLRIQLSLIFEIITISQTIQLNFLRKKNFLIFIME